ncbi:MAG: protein kinase domain-containing protein, partial [Thermoanaerobaculia bacterium]
MTLLAGSKLGPYEVLGQIGAGGMGEVYRAKDPRLGREVAIKVLPASFSADAGRLRRFEQEARAAGALNHANITAVYDIGLHEGAPYVVSELLEGETLDSRLAGGPLPPRKAVDYAIQIAHGLAAAHEKGIVHRDLKPENLFITRDGRVKILDFGLAKFVATEGEDVPLPGSSATSAKTEPGMVLGTLGYMSPEQLRGKQADPRSDIFSFGAILFEMLAGKRAFPGASAADAISAILRADPPDLLETNRQIPPALERIVRHCLEKQPEERFRSAHDLAFALEAVSGSPGSGSAAVPLPGRSGLRFRWESLRSIGLLAAALLAGAALDRWLRPPAAPVPVRIRALTYSGRDFSPAASPDGLTLAFASERDGRRRIWVKQLAAGNEVALTSGTDDNPRFSPDGSMILFSRTEGQRSSLYRVPLVGGDPRKLVDEASDGDWSPDGQRITFVRHVVEKGVRVSAVFVAAADGTGPREVARVREHALRWPRWSPDGRQIALVDSGLAGAYRPLVIVGVDGGAPRLLPPLERGAVVAATWSGDGREIVYSTAVRGAGARVVRQNPKGGQPRTIFWIPTDNEVLDILGPDTLLYESIATRQNLRELPIGRGAPPADQW